MDDVRLAVIDEELVMYTVIDGEYVVCEEVVTLGLGLGLWVTVELPDTVGLDDAAVL